MEFNSKKNLLPSFYEGGMEKTFLFFILISYFLLAVNKIIPFQSVDEGMLAKWAWELHKDPFPVVQYPPFFLYFHFYLSLLYKGFFVLFGLANSGVDFINSGIGYKFMIEAGRVVTAVTGTLMLLMVYKIGKEFYNRKVAFFSVIIIAFNNLFILHSHIFKSDILLSLLLVIFIYFLFRFISEPGKKWLFIASFFFGLSFAAKYNIFVIPLILMIAVIFNRKTVKILNGLILIAAGALTGFFIGAPNWIVNPAGNLKLLFKIFIEKDSPIFYLKDLGPVQIYSFFIKDLFIQFGPVLGLIFLVSIIVTFIKREKKDILLTIFIIFYIFFFGFTGFYGNRFILPLFPAFVLLAGKTIFSDAFELFNIRKKYKLYLFSFVWILLAAFSLNKISSSIKTFGLLKTKTKSESVINYRFNHNINNKEFNVASQAFSPLLRGDIRFRKTFVIKGKKKIPGNVIHFSQVNKTHYDIYNKKINRSGREKIIDIVNFRIFHEIKKPKFQTWDDDFLFFYNLPESLKGLEHGNKPLKLPRSYYDSGKDSFFPLQVYEKSPGFGRSSRGFFFHRIYSKNKIGKIIFSIFIPGTKVDMFLKVNGVRKLLAKNDFKGFIKRVEIEGFKKEPFSYDFQYSLEIVPVSGELVSDKFPGYYIVFDPVLSEEVNDSAGPGLNNITPNSIPMLFSGKEYSVWMKKFYTEYGIDLSLYDFLNTEFLRTIKDESPFAARSDFYPLRNGRYIINIVTGNSVEGNIPKAGGILGYEIYEKNKLTKGEIELKSVNRFNYYFDIDTDGEIVFVRFFPNKMKNNNIHIKKISIRPDILDYLNKQKNN